MRMSDRIIFVSQSDDGYNPDTGKHEEGETVKATKPCKLSTMGTDRTKELFGQIDIQVIVARLQRPYLKEFDHILIEKGLYKGKYQVKRQSDYRKGVFYLEGVSNAG